MIYLERSKDAGFTLIELSIVLVIIGLLVGGVLAGQDLIKAAEQRATIAQIEKYNTAVNTFRNKYNGLPGDIAEARAAAFGLYPLLGAVPLGGAGVGDDNGLIEGGSSGGIAINGEVVLVFRHLSDAALVDGTYAQTGVTTGTITNTGTIGSLTGTGGMPLLLPAAKLGRGNYIFPMAYSGVNYFVMTGMGKALITTAGIVTSQTNNLTPIEAYNMDRKMDDGLSASGSVQTIDGTQQISTAGTINTTGGPAACATAASGAYVVSPGTSLLCSLRFRFN